MIANHKMEQVLTSDINANSQHIGTLLPLPKRLAESARKIDQCCPLVEYLSAP